MKAVIHEGATSTRRRYEVSKEGMTTVSGEYWGIEMFDLYSVYLYGIDCNRIMGKAIEDFYRLREGDLCIDYKDIRILIGCGGACSSLSSS